MKNPPSIDRIYDRYVERQRLELETLAAESDIVTVSAIGADRFVVTMQVKTLVSPLPGVVEQAEGVVFGLWVHDGFLRRPNPSAVITLLAPQGLFHPNAKGPLVCVGPIEPGTSLVELVARVHDLVSLNEYCCDEHDAFNREACVWIRRNLHRLPLDSRPLKSRRASSPIASGIEGAATASAVGMSLADTASRLGIIEVEGVAEPSGGLQA